MGSSKNTIRIYKTKGEMTMKRIVITGALGQIGTELVLKCRQLYGKNNVLATDIREPNHIH